MIDRTILIADDEEGVLDVLAEIVTDVGGEPLLARTGAEAVELFLRHRPRVVLTDLRIPDLDGLEVARRVRDVDPQVAVFIVTGHADLSSAIEAVRRGAYDYIPKPFDVEDLSRRLGRAMERQRIAAEVVEQDRLAVVGQMTVAINHSILNPLSGILGALHVLDGADVDAATRAEAVAQAQREAVRIETTVKGLRSLTSARVVDYVGAAKMLDLGVAGRAASG